MEINVLSNLRKNSCQVFSCSVFTVRCDKYFIAKTNDIHNFFIIEPTNWVNTIAITDNQEVILVKQYRYGIEKITLEIPGGMIDKEELPEIAAQRELLEETGYKAKSWQLIGITDPNPAIQNNKCYIFLATGLEFTTDPKLDNTEEIEVVTVALNKIPEMIQQGKITHSLVITAFYYYNLLKEK